MFGIVILSTDNTAEVMMPSKLSFNLPTPLGAAQRPAILRRVCFPVVILAMRRHQSNPPLLPKFLVQRVAVVGLATHSSESLCEPCATPCQTGKICKIVMIINSYGFPVRTRIARLGRGNTGIRVESTEIRVADRWDWGFSGMAFNRLRKIA